MIWLMWVVGILLFFIVIGLFLYFSYIKIKLNGILNGMDGSLEGQIYIWKLRVFRFAIPDVKLEDDPLELIVQHKSTANGEKDAAIDKGEMHTLIDRMKAIWAVMHEKSPVERIFHLQDLNWETNIGCEQADFTAILVGVVWAIKTSVLGLTQRFVTLDPPMLQVNPCFNQWRLETKLTCMISFQLGKAIRQAFWIRKQLKRRRLLHGGTSHSRTHENSA